eukprot:TRINITY_DN1438_c1_g1_i1.p1 TRINITY_DN1438_c1_g1~~TRINITY_DN1438_c1_g1_i1.p1  ORF type:complete len:410 (+),score=54.54 TRINITY_DN1438_c1_g1_i1:45-1232(+)
MMSVLMMAVTMSVTPWPELKGKLESALTLVAQNESSRWNDSSVTISFLNSQGTVDVAAGYRDIEKEIDALPNDSDLAGSATKMVTSAAVLQLVEKGVFGIDDNITKLIDPYLMKYNSTTLETIFGPNITRVTVRHLLSMRTGLLDYDSEALRIWQTEHPGYDITPFDVIHISPPYFVCYPGECGWYASTNYVIAGFLLTAFSGPNHDTMVPWYEYRQASVLPRRVGAEYASCEFPIFGTLGEYQTKSNNVSNGYQPDGSSVWNISANGGWTCGNMLTNAGDLARLTYDLYGPPGKFLSKAMLSIDAVYEFRYLYNLKVLYGLGTILMSADPNAGYLVGHGGATYGFYSEVGFNSKFNFSLAVMTNHEEPVYFSNMGEMMSAAYLAVLEILSGAGQ